MVGVGLTIAWIAGAGPDQVATVGEPAPDFTVEVIEGGEFTLSDSDVPVVINFWASWCLPCREEIPEISAFATANPGVQVIGVAIRDVATSARQFADEIGASYPLALGNAHIEEAYPVLGLPATYVIDAEGNVSELYNGIVDQEILAGLVAGS